MKKAVLALVLFSNYLFGQDLNVKWGELGQLYVNKDNGGFVHFDVKALESVESKFNSQSPLNRSIRNFERGLNGFIKTKNHLYYPLLDISSNRQKLYLQEIDGQGKLKGSYKLVADDNYEMVKFLSSKYSYPHDIDGLAVSNNAEVILRVTSSGFAVQKVPQKLSLTVLDENLKVLWNKIQEFPNYLDPDFALSDFMVTNDGKVVLSAIITKESNNKKDSPKYSFCVFIISKDNLIESEIPLSADTKPLLSKLIEGENGQIVIAGFYKNSNNILNNYNGSFIASVSLSNGDVINTASYPFTDAVFTTEHPSKKLMDAGIQGVRITDLLKSSLGNYFLVACYDGSLPPLTWNGGQSGALYSYATYGKHLAIGYNNSLKKTFESVVKGSFITLRSNYSPRAFIVDNKILILYNSCGSNNTIDYAISAALIDESGKTLINQKLAFQYKGMEMDPYFVRQFDASSVILNICAFGSMSKRSDTDFKEGLLRIEAEPSSY